MKTLREMIDLIESAQRPVAEGVAIVKQDYDLDQMVYVLDVDGKKVSFTYWDYEDDFNNPDIKDIYQQAREQLGKKLSPEQIKAVAGAVFKSFEQGVAKGTSAELEQLIQQYEDRVEDVYGMVPGPRKRRAIEQRDALEAQIEALPGGRAALEKWARAYNDSFDESVTEEQLEETTPEAIAKIDELTR